MAIPPDVYDALVPNGTKDNKTCVPASIALGGVEGVACKTNHVAGIIKYNVQFKKHNDGNVFAVVSREKGRGDVQIILAEQIIYESNYMSSYNRALSSYIIEEQKNIVKSVVNKDKNIEVACEASALPNKIYIRDKGWLFK